MCSIHFHFSSLYGDFVSGTKQELDVDVKECLAMHTKGHKDVYAGPFTLDSRGNPTVTCLLKHSGIFNSKHEEEPRILGTYTIMLKPSTDPPTLETKKREIQQAHTSREDSKPVTDHQTLMPNKKTIHEAPTREADSKPYVPSSEDKLCARFFLRWAATRYRLVDPITNSLISAFIQKEKRV